MKLNYRKPPATFADDIPFEVRPAPPVPFRGSEETHLERLKARFVAEALLDASSAGLESLVRRAANEAAAAAWFTPFPLLVFPALFDEKATQAREQARRQERILHRNRTSAMSS